MAKIEGTLVRIWRSVGTKPRSIFTPTFSSPRFSELGRRPTVTRILSAATVFLPSLVSNETSMAPALSAQPVAFASRKLSMPSFFILRATTFTTSGSLPGRSWFVPSSTVTLAPSLAHIMPSSSPM